MALIKPSALVSEFKGVLNGSIFQGSKFGTVMRNRKSGIAKHSTYLETSQNVYTYIVKYWRNLTLINQTAWNTAGLSYNFTDKFGNIYNPSGFQLFCTLNFVRFVKSGTVFTSPPTMRTPTDSGKITITCNYTNTLSVSWTTYTSAQNFIRIYASNILSNGVVRVPTTIPFIQSVVSGPSTQVNIWNNYVSRFRAPSAGAGRIFIRTLVFDQRECLLIYPNSEFISL